MPENNTHSTEDAAEIQERRNYVAYQGIPLEVRAAAEGEESRTIGGYAVKYNTPVVITDRWGDKYLEEIAAGCFDESLSRCKENGSEIKALWNHDTSRPLGSTKTDTLRFNMGDTTGLNYDIDLPKNEAEEYYIQVDVWSEEDCFLLKRKIKKLLKKAGFTYFAGNDDYEQDTKIYHKAARFYFLINTEGED